MSIFDINQIWMYFYNNYPDLITVNTPFWPTYNRFQVEQLHLNSLMDGTYNELDQQRILEATSILKHGRTGSLNVTIDEMVSINSRTHETYEKNAQEYDEININTPSLDLQLERFIKLINQKGLILDLGTGTGRDAAKLMLNNQNTIAIDYAFNMLRYAKSMGRISTIAQMNVKNLGIKKLSVAGIWCVAVLLHLDKTEVVEVLRESYRVLIPEGIIFISVKQGSGKEIVCRKNMADMPRLFTYFSIDDINTLMYEGDFEILDISRNLNYRDGIGWDVWINVLAKKSGKA